MSQNCKRGKRKKGKLILPVRHREGIFCPFPACKNSSMRGENVPGPNPLAGACLQEPVRTKVLYWTSCHLGPIYYTIGSKPWTKLITDPLGGK